MIRRFGFVAAAAVVLALFGCGDAAPPYKYRVVVIPKGLDHEFWQSIRRGADKAAKDLQAQGLIVKVIWDGPQKENDAAEQVSVVNRYVAERVNGIALAPQHSQNMVPAVQEAAKQNIPVVIFDSGLVDQGPIIKYIATDNYHGGQLAAEALLAALAKEGKKAPRLILFRYQPGSESTDQREQGFVDVVNEAIEKQKANRESMITIVSDNQYAGPTQDTALREATPLLERFRDGVDGIFAPNESSAEGMVNALRNVGLSQKIKLVGFDASQPLLQAVKQGDVEALIVQDPFKMGYLSVWTLVQHLEGKNVAPDGKKTLSTGEYVLTRDNMDDVASKERFEKTVQSERRIETPEYPKR